MKQLHPARFNRRQALTMTLGLMSGLPLLRLRVVHRPIATSLSTNFTARSASSAWNSPKRSSS